MRILNAILHNDISYVGKTVICFGYGRIGKEIYEYLKKIETITSFICDNDSSKWTYNASEKVEYPIFSPEYVFSHFGNALFLITVGNKSVVSKIKMQLLDAGVSEDFIDADVVPCYEDWKQDPINRKFVNENGAVLTEIEIETVNRCNGICPFCPVNVNEPQREYHKMSRELFEKIIADLKNMKFKGKMSLFSNNEPFLDERIIDFHKFAYEQLPDVKHHLYTNGSLLTLERFKAIVPYLDYFVIDNYNDKKIVNENLRDVYEYLQNNETIRKKVNFSFRFQNEVLSSRGGQAPNKKESICSESLCLLPFRQMVIRPDGKVSLCCNDALGKVTLGDVNEKSVDEIFNSEAYCNIREGMLKNGRKVHFLCKNCDTGTEPFSSL